MSVTERLHNQLVQTFLKMCKQQGRRHKTSEFSFWFFSSAHTDHISMRRWVKLICTQADKLHLPGASVLAWLDHHWSSKHFFCSGDTFGHRNSDTNIRGPPCVWEQRWAQRRQRKAGPSSWSHSYMSPASCVLGQFWWAPGTPGPPLQLWSWRWQEWSCQLSVCSGLDGNEERKGHYYLAYSAGTFWERSEHLQKKHLESKKKKRKKKGGFIQKSMSGLKCVPPPCVCLWGECRSSLLSGWMLLQWSPCGSWCHHPVNRGPPPTVTQTEQQSVQIMLRTSRNKKKN